MLGEEFTAGSTEDTDDEVEERLRLLELLFELGELVPEVGDFAAERG
jgi:hypothetical protein